MKADLSAYSFRPATMGDLPRLRRWLHAPEVKRWWGRPSEQFELLREDLNEPRMRMRIVSFNGRPFAYAQDYEVHAWPQFHLAHLPRGARAIDSFIGWPSMIGRGHGQAYLRLLAERLCAEGAPLIAIDPAAATTPRSSLIWSDTAAGFTPSRSIRISRRAPRPISSICRRRSSRRRPASRTTCPGVRRDLCLRRHNSAVFGLARRSEIRGQVASSRCTPSEAGAEC